MHRTIRNFTRLGVAAGLAFSAAAPAAVSRFGALPLQLEHNQGQAAEGIDAIARGQGYVMALADDQVQIRFRAHDDVAASTLTTRLLGTSPSAAQMQRPLPGKVHYLVGRDRNRTDLPTFGALRYDAIYPGIDLVYYGNQQQLEYDFIVAPGADPAPIRIGYDGADEARLDEQGNLRLRVARSEIVQHRPIVYQTIDGRRVDVEAAFVLNADRREIGFALGHYDRSQELVIDPVLSYSTYLSGNGSDIAYAIDVDSAGNVYIAGSTASSDFNIVGGIPGEGDQAQDDIFISKLNPAGDTLIYSTYLGGNNQEAALALTVDADGNAYVTGYTNSTDFNLVNPLQDQKSVASDIFVSKLNAAGNALLYSTYLGGGGDDAGYGITVDGSGSAYIAATVGSPNIVSSGSCDTGNAYVAKLAPAGNSLVYATCFGGSNADYGYAIALDASANAYVVGRTDSTDFPVVLGLPEPGDGTGPDGYLTKFSADGSSILYSGYLGGNGSDEAKAVVTSHPSNAFVAGRSGSNNFPIVDGIPGEENEAGNNAFVTHIQTSNGLMIFSSLLGGSGSDSANAVGIDGSSNLYIAGVTASTDFDVVNGLPGEGDKGGDDVFVALFDEFDRELAFSTYLGGGGTDTVRGMAVAHNGTVFITGDTLSVDFPIVGGIPGEVDAGSRDVFISRIDPDAPPSPAGTVQLSALGDVGEGAGFTSLFVTRSGGSSGAVTVDYATSDDTATAGDDYTSTSGTLSWADGDSQPKLILLQLIDDADVEGDETLIVTLSNPTGGATLGALASDTLTIVDNDIPNGDTLQFAATAYSAPEPGTRRTVSDIVVTVERDGDAIGGISVDYRSVDGSAIGGLDYGPVQGTLVWGDGDHSPRTITVHLLYDDVREEQEDFQLILEHAGGGAVVGDPAQTTLSIIGRARAY